MSLLEETLQEDNKRTCTYGLFFKTAKKKGGALLLVRRGRTTFLALLTLSD